MDPASSSELLKLLDTVLTAARKAEGCDPSERDRAVDGLKALGQAVVSSSLLGETQAGKKVKQLTKHPNGAVSAAAAKVLASWKALVRRESGSTKDASMASSGGGGLSSRAPSSAALGDSQQAQQSMERDGDAAAASADISSKVKSEESIPLPPPPPPAKTVTAPPPEAPLPTTGDAVRDKIRSNFVAALRQAAAEGTAPARSVVELGVSIELALYAAHDGVTPAYKAKFRQLHFNLKDAKNPDLRRRVVEGEIPAEELITLTPEELASDAKREENDRIREKKLFDAAPSAAKQATTDQFQCGKCRQRKCTYYQMQTRSADEPMTTFVRCMNCSNAWKFC